MSVRENILDLMRDGRWRTYEAIAATLGIKKETVNQRVVDLQAEGYVVERRREKLSSRFYEYRFCEKTGG